MLVLDGVSKTYESFELGPISFTADTGVLAILGPSGCGKTTLLWTIAGITKPETGTITLNGHPLTELPPEDRGTTLVFQDGALFPHLTAFDNIAYAAGESVAIHDLADRLGIASILDQPATTLSGGQRQRVALARSLAAEPNALLLDEPLANLDAPEKRRLRGEVRDILDDLDIPAVYVTHDLREATVVGDRVGIMDTGQIVQLGRPEEVFDRPATPAVASFTGGANVFTAVVTQAETGVVLEWAGTRLTVPDYGFSDGATVRFCIRPEYIEPAGGDDGNTVECHIRRRSFEGDGYRVRLDPIDGDEELEWVLLPPAFERAGLADRDSISVTLPAAAIHLMGDGGPPP